MKQLHIDYRPVILDEFVGQDHVKKVLQTMFDGDEVAKTFLFHGPSGSGKTTLARIINKRLKGLLIEYDGGNFTGVDDTRQLIEFSNFQNFDGSVKVFIIDECHMLSKNSWNALLKTIEETPKHSYFIFCTTEISKVPKTIRSRCHELVLKKLSDKNIKTVLEIVCKENSIDESCIKDVVNLSEGNARKALMLLSEFSNSGKISDDIEENNETLEICRLIARKDDLNKIIQSIKDSEISDFESLRIQVFNYLTACAIGNFKYERIDYYLYGLSCFENSIKMKSTGKGEFILMCARCFEED